MTNVYKELVKTSYQDTQCFLMTRAILKLNKSLYHLELLYQYLQLFSFISGVHIVIQMGLTALSLVCSVFVLRLVHTDYKDVPEVLRKVRFFTE